MTYLNRDRKKRLRNFTKIYGDGEFQLGKWKLEPVHLIPEQIEYGQEFDFWISNGKDVFLLSCECSKIQRIFISKYNARKHIYIRFQGPFRKLELEDISNILNTFSGIGIPKKSRFKIIKNLSLKTRNLR
ncbi:MAG: hypothetical protein GY714_30695 [Desulfobacterales bacterium]|nr:hypothetical protein [Desulfobacterales bacterium]